MTVGAAVAGIMLIVSALGLPLLGWLVFIGGIYYGMWIFRKTLGGVVSYIRALNVGFQTAFFASLILAFFAYLSTTMDSSLIPSILNAAEEQLKTSKIPSELVDNVVQQWREILSPVIFAGIMIFMYSATGGFVSIILAIFVRKNKNCEL